MLRASDLYPEIKMELIQTKKELNKLDLKPVKHRGQNFLVSEEIIERIISEAKIKKGERILEVGPGTGNLTKALIDAGAIVLAIEKDKNLSQVLISNFQFLISKKILNVVNEDILKFNEVKIKKPYRIIANIPYYLTGHLIQKFLLSKNKPSEMIIMVQKEVGERISAKPPKMNYLVSLVQFLANTEILFPVKKENFWPQPKVDSVVIKLTPRQRLTSLRSYARETFGVKDSKNNEDKRFIEFLKVVFKQPRQTLFNNLRRGGIKNSEEIIIKLGFDKKVRAQNLSLQQLTKLFAMFSVHSY